MKRFKVNVPIVLAIALVATLNSCNTQRIKEEQEKQKFMIDSNISFEDVFTPVDDELFDNETGTLKDLDVLEVQKTKTK